MTIAFSLLGHISILDIVILEYLIPEAGQLMTVADLHNVELLQNAAVKLQLVLLEFG